MFSFVRFCCARKVKVKMSFRRGATSGLFIHRLFIRRRRIATAGWGDHGFKKGGCDAAACAGRAGVCLGSTSFPDARFHGD